MLQESVSVTSGLILPAVEAAIFVHNLNHYFGTDAPKKQVLFDINLEIQASSLPSQLC